MVCNARRVTGTTAVAAMLLVTSLAIPAHGQLQQLRKHRQTDSRTSVAETPMVLIPAGDFWMGSDGNDALADEKPRHEVWVGTFSIDQFEVTTAQYAMFLATTHRPPPWQWSSVDLVIHSDRPVIGVDWHDAAAYCRWAGKRLPSEAEWEKAARGTDERRYPWGNDEPSSMLAHFGLGARFSYAQVLLPVDQFERGRSPYGANQMAGNVMEWVEDWYAVDYYSRSPRRDPSGPETGQFKVVRGGSWSDLPKYMLTYGRFKLPPATRNSYVGFRCARSEG